MKQITLTNQSYFPEEFCSGRLFAVWGLFGAGSAMVWPLAGDDLIAQAAVWIVCAAAALALLLALEI